MAEAGAPPEADREGDLPHPRTVYDLFAHSEAEAAAAAALTSGRMHHAWMITGPKGVGKATLAYRIARRALGAAPAGTGLAADPGDPACRQIEALSHPDFLLIRTPWDEKTKRLKKSVSVEEARRAPDFFSRRASLGGWRVVIVDAVDEMNANAANALLKTLEEPPHQGLLLLIAHAPGRLPPTLRSRCRVLALRPPAPAETAGWLVDAHGLSAEDAQSAAALAAGAPGRALALAAAEIPALKARLDQALAGLPRLDPAAVSALAGLGASLAGGEGAKRALLDLMRAETRARAAEAAGAGGDLALAGQWAQADAALSRLARESETLYLDPKETLYAAFAALEAAAASIPSR